MPIQPNNNKNVIVDSNITAGGNVHIGDNIINFIVQQVNPQNLPNYKSRIQNFFDEYLGTAISTVPFGGREKELESLDNWLTDPKAPPYALIAAEAGRGKSALLTQWTKSLLARQLARVVFIPVSIRFNTALSSVAFPTLATSLAGSFGETVTQSNLSAEQWRSECLRYMQKVHPMANH